MTDVYSLAFILTFNPSDKKRLVSRAIEVGIRIDWANIGN